MIIIRLSKSCDNYHFDEISLKHKQVSKFAVSSFTKIMQSSVHADYLAWGWDVLLKLRLHESEAGREVEDDDDDDDSDENDASGFGERKNSLFSSFFDWRQLIFGREIFWSDSPLTVVSLM